MLSSKDLTAFYAFNDNSLDYSKSNKNLTNNNLFVNGLIGKGIKTTQNGQCFVGSYTDINSFGNADFSINVIFKIISVKPVYNQVVVIKGASYFDYYIYVTPTQKIAFMRRSNITSYIEYSCEVNTWYNVTAVFSNLSKKMMLYVNYALVGSVSFDAASAATNEMLTLGYFTVSPNHWFDGVIDNVMIFKKAININDIKRLHFNLHPIQ